MDRTAIVDRVWTPDPTWGDVALQVLEVLVRLQSEVTTADLWRLVVYPSGPAGGRAMGRVILSGIRMGLIEKYMEDGHLHCLDVPDIGRIVTLDGTVILARKPLTIYRTMP